MTELSSLLRRDCERRFRRRRVAALACAVTVAGTFVIGAHAAALEPDPSAGPAATGLQPDAFPAPAIPKPKPAIAAAPTAPASVGHALVQAPTATPSETTPQVTSAPAPSTTVRVAPPTPPAVVPPVRPAVHRQAKPHAVHRVIQHRHAARLLLPARVAGTLAMPATTETFVVPVPAAGLERNLLPAALALLALVATSTCLLAAALRAQRELET
jgi:hypothetical protein